MFAVNGLKYGTAEVNLDKASDSPGRKEQICGSVGVDVGSAGVSAGSVGINVSGAGVNEWEAET